MFTAASTFKNKVRLYKHSLQVQKDTMKLIPNYHQSKLLRHLLTIFVVIIIADSMEQKFNDLNVERLTIHSYCRSFKSCHDCKRAAFQCEWCHDIGCTNHARLYCPKKVFLDNLWKKDGMNRYCTELVTRGPVFLPANVRRFMKIELKVDDMTLYERNIVCEIHLERKIIQVAGSLDKNIVYCDTMVLKISRNVAIGYLRLIWGGAEPYSDMILLIVYNCHTLAASCVDCQGLNKEFQCGWCKDTLNCSLMEQCPRQYGPWITRNNTCGRHDNSLSKLEQTKSLWYK